MAVIFRYIGKLVFQRLDSNNQVVLPQYSICIPVCCAQHQVHNEVVSVRALRPTNAKDQVQKNWKLADVKLKHLEIQAA